MSPEFSITTRQQNLLSTLWNGSKDGFRNLILNWRSRAHLGSHPIDLQRNFVPWWITQSLLLAKLAPNIFSRRICGEAMLVVRCRFVLCQNPHSRRYQFVHRFAARPHRGAEYSLLAEPNADHCCDEYEAFFPADVVRDG